MFLREVDTSMHTMVLFNQIMKYQLSHMQFNQISDHKDDIYLNGKLYTKLLGQAVNKNTKFMFIKSVQLLFS